MEFYLAVAIFVAVVVIAAFVAYEHYNYMKWSRNRDKNTEKVKTAVEQACKREKK